ncbi:MAG TPA: VOC family protein [Acidimicrobiales bacterium]|nr:VOC family protein [Acidimicrobiales bacterium]
MASPPSSSGDAAATAVLDHVAVAVERWSDAWPRYVHQLGGTWHSGGVNSGFSPAQLSYANGAKVEILQPWEPEANPFLRRFLDHSGPGPHHLTFKVPDIEVALGRVVDAGFEPVGVRLEDPQWREAFLHPRQATGVVVQLAQAEFEWISPAPEGFPAGRRAPAAALDHVTHGVRDLDAALTLFQELLGGVVTMPAVGPDGTWEFVDVSWTGPLGLRLVAPTAGADPASWLRTWLGDRPGRVHHLAFDLPRALPATDPASAEATGAQDGAAVPGVTVGSEAVQVVAPQDNLGTGLVLLTRGGR